MSSTCPPLRSSAIGSLRIGRIHVFPESLTVFLLPPEHRLRLRTSNLLENLNQQIRRRTRIASLFPNTASLLRLVSAITSELSDDWLAAKASLHMNPPSQLLSA